MGTPLVQVKAHLPVSESFGFVSALRQQTGGQAFPQCVFSHWDAMPGDAMEVGGKMQELCLAVRKRKNVKGDPGTRRLLGQALMRTTQTAMSRHSDRKLHILGSVGLFMVDVWA